jgi:teichuronic acid biosynthesis protein TuaE
MTKEDRSRNIVLAIIFAIAGFLGIVNGSYLITAMYIITIIAVTFVMKEKDTYNLLYAVLLVSTFYDYALYVPGIKSIYMFHIVLGVFTLISLYKAFKDRDVLLNLDRKVLSIYVIWFIYMCCSVTWALNRRLSIKYIAIYLMMFAFSVSMMIYNINKERLKNTINLVLFLVSLIIIIGAIEVALGEQLPIKHYFDEMNLSQLHTNIIQARAIVFSFNTNNLAATLAILSPICLFSIYRFHSMLAKLWFTFATCAGFALVVITTSRTGIFAMCLSLAAFIIYSIFRIRTFKVQALIFPLILCLSFVFLYFNSSKFQHIRPVDGKEIVDTGLNDKLKELNSEFEEGASGSVNERLTIIMDVINGVIKEKQYLGFGVGNVEQYLRDKGNSRGVYSPHCYVIEILGDFGFPGIALYAVFYLYLLIQNVIIGIKKKSLMCFAAVAGLIAFAPASFGPSSITYVFSYWLLMGFSVACIQVYKQEEDAGYKKTSLIKEFRII